MTQVDFYILQKSSAEDTRLHFVCRLLEKVLRQGHRVLVNSQSEAQCKRLSDLLWSYKPESYIPHDVITSAEDSLQSDAPIALSHTIDVAGHHDVLLGLQETIPPYFARFARYAHVVNQEPKLLAVSRDHFAYFRDQGYPTKVNKLDL